MDAWRRRFVRNILLVTLGLEVPSGVLLADLLARAMPTAPAVALALALLAVLNAPLVYRLTHWREDHRSSELYVWLAETPFFLHFCASLFFGPLGWLCLLGAGIYRALGHHPPPPASYLGPVYAAALALSAYATFARRFWVRVRDVHVPVQGLPPALAGYTLVQLSDVHCGPYTPRWFYRRVARRASALGADAIVVTGDLITSGVGYLDDVADFARGLAAPDGVFACLGNHDYYGTVDGVARALEAGGARVLRNAGVDLAAARDGGLHLAGMDDNWSQRDDLAATLAGVVPGRPCVLLAHDPKTFVRAVAHGGVDVVLSGHTHAGQFAVPFAVRRFNLANIHHRFTSGVYRDGRTTLYVHPGNGTSGPPARIGAAPEIARIVLRPA